MPVGSGRRERKKYQAERKACTRLNRSGSPRIDYISRWLLDKRTFVEWVGERGGRKRKSNSRETVRGISWQSGQRRGVVAGETGEREKNPRLIWHLMDYCPGKPEDFFPSPFSRSPASREKMDPANGVCRSKLLCAKIELYIVLSPLVRVPRHIHLGPFNVGNGHAGIQIPKLL